MKSTLKILLAPLLIISMTSMKFPDKNEKAEVVWEWVESAGEGKVNVYYFFDQELSQNHQFEFTAYFQSSMETTHLPTQYEIVSQGEAYIIVTYDLPTGIIYGGYLNYWYTVSYLSPI